MKKQIKSLLLIIAVVAGITTNVFAQRDRGHSDNDHRDRDSHVRNDHSSGGDRGVRNDRVVRDRVEPRNNTVSVNTNRYRPVTSIRRDNDRVYNTTISRSYRNDRPYEERRYFVMGGPRYRTIPYSYTSVYYGGRPYYYTHGLFYYQLDGFYQAIYPPFGIRVRVLPYGYAPIYIGPELYYYYNGVYYRKYDDQNYEVIQPPVGAVVTSLPQGAKAVLLNGEKFYELNGTYYKEGTDANGGLTYTVVGKNGAINNSDSQQPATGPVTYRVGDIIPELPSGCKIITLNGDRLYVSPDDIYFKEIRDGNQVSYKVIGNSL